MSKGKLPPEEGCGGGHIEIPLPISVNDSFEKGRVFHYGITRWGYGFLLFIAVGCALTAIAHLPVWFYLLWGFLLLPTVALLLLSQYEIRHDREGFSVCLGSRVLRRYAWSDVTGVNEQKRVFVGGKKLFAEPSMSGYEAFYARARAACKKNGQPLPPLEKKQKNRQKPPTQEGKDDESKGYVEISLPNLSGIKDKVDDVIERIEDAVDNNGQKYMPRDSRVMFEEDRVLFNPSLSLHGYGVIVCVVVMWGICMIAQAPLEGYALCGVLLLPAIALILLGKYEIRHDKDGFSACLGKRILRRYAWSDVTAVNDEKRVFVGGRKLFADPYMSGYEAFYARARAACKGKGKPTPPSEKKRRNRQKPPTKKSK